MTPITAGECIRYGLEAFTRRPGVLVAALVLLGMVSVALELPGWLAGGGEGGALSAVLGIASYLGSMLLSLGSYAFYLHAHDDIDSVGLAELWHPEGFWRFLGATLLLMAATVALCLAAAALPLLVLGNDASLQIPLVIVAVSAAATFAIRYIFAPALAVDGLIGPIEAMQESARLMKGRTISMSWLLFLLFGINLLGLLCLVFGLLATIPIATISFLHAFRLAQAAAEPPAAPLLAVEPA